MSKKNKYSVQTTGSDAATMTKENVPVEETVPVIEAEKATLTEATPEEVAEEQLASVPTGIVETVKTEVLQEATPAPAPVAKPVAGAVQVAPKQAVNPAINRRVQTFEFQCNQYIALCKQQICNEAMLTKKLYQFATIIRMIINTTDVAVYDAAYKFFKEYRNTILSEDTIFSYIHKIPTEQSIRMQTVYTSFREMVDSNINKHRFALDYGLIRDNMKLPAQHPLLNWMRKKLGNNN